MKEQSKAESVFATLDAGLEAAKRRGVRIVCGRFGDGASVCCALTSIADGMDDAMAALKITADEAWSLVWGFDGADVLNPRENISAFRKVGQRLRAKHLPS
jgi:hypothetical protein